MMTIKQVLQSHIDSGSTLGASVLLVRDGKTELQVCAGGADSGVPMREDSIFLWLSSGKPVTAIAIAWLYENGRLGLDDPVIRHLPKFAAEGKSAITIRHLLTHTAGLHKSLPAVWEFNDWDTIIRHICASPLASGFVPGEMAAYDAGASWFILGEIIQRITQQPFEDFIRKRIFTPCGMPQAAYSASHQALDSKIVGYFNTAGGRPHPVSWNTPAIARVPRPGASLRAPIDEMVRFYQGLQDGLVISPQTLALFTSPSRGKLLDKTFGLPLDWGLGIMVNNGPRTPYNFGEQASPQAFGHGGQQSSLAFRDPVTRTIFAAAYNGLCGELQHNLRMRELLECL